MCYAFDLLLSYSCLLLRLRYRWRACLSACSYNITILTSFLSSACFLFLRSFLFIDALFSGWLSRKRANWSKDKDRLLSIGGGLASLLPIPLTFDSYTCSFSYSCWPVYSDCSFLVPAFAFAFYYSKVAVSVTVSPADSLVTSRLAFD